jgi:hypothetical protein
VEITKIERNDLYRIIRKARLKPRDFTFRHEPESSVIVIQHPRTGGWIGLSLDGDEPRDWEIGMDRPLPNTSRAVVVLNLAVRGRPEAWKYMLGIVTAWTSQIRERVAELERQEKARREYEAIPDLWEQIAKPGIPASEPDVNASFNSDERRQITAGIQTAKNRAEADPDITAEQLEAITRRLDEAAEASTRLGRKDWLALLYGQILTLMTADLIPPHIVQGLFTGIMHAISPIFGGSLALP